jgi:hypothetical protein
MPFFRTGACHTLGYQLAGLSCQSRLGLVSLVHFDPVGNDERV